jgi:hypothetical protein
MPTQEEETQVKEFLRRAEVRTMKKDLQYLREADALKERAKIVNIKTLEEQRLEQQKKLEQIEKEKQEAEKAKTERVLSENVKQEKIAEKELKNYATEEERQQIFLFESQRLGFENQILEIDNKKDPALKLDKNKILLEKRNWEQKLNGVKENISKLDTEEKFIDDKINQTTISSEKKSLEKRRWEIEDQRKEIEKKAWEIEKNIENTNKKISQIDKSSEQLVAERNDLNQKVLGIDKSLREIYSVVIAREEEKRKGLAEEQRAQKEALSKTREEQKETIRRQQWKNPISNITIPVPAKGRIARTAESEEEMRKQFMKNVETRASEKSASSTPEAPPKINK